MKKMYKGSNDGKLYESFNDAKLAGNKVVNAVDMEFDAKPYLIAMIVVEVIIELSNLLFGSVILNGITLDIAIAAIGGLKYLSVKENVKKLEEV